jgi:hypothetical protein
MTVAKPKLRWFQYSLRTLLVFVTLCAIPCSWLAVKMQQVRRQREAVAAIEKLSGYVGWSEPSGPAWLQSPLGDDFFRSVVRVVLAGTPVTDADLEYLKGMNQLQMLDISYNQVTDAGVEHLEGLNQLQELRLCNANVTDAGIEHLKGLNQLIGLNLWGTKVTDAGLENLKRLNRLQHLDLRYTKVTDAGVNKIQQALPNCKIYR